MNSKLIKVAFLTIVLIFLWYIYNNKFNLDDNKPLRSYYENISTSIYPNVGIQNKQLYRRQNEKVLFFNRIGKTGSEMVAYLLRKLQKKNHFTHIRFVTDLTHRHLTEDELEDLTKEMKEMISSRNGQLISFDRHLHFANFSNYGMEMPILINIVREPVERLISRFYYVRRASAKNRVLMYANSTLEECLKDDSPYCVLKDGQECIDLLIPYFCGNELFCRIVNDKSAFVRAKSNVDQWYRAIGVLEEFDATLALFEKAVPNFFRGASDLFHEGLKGEKKNKNDDKKEVSQWARDRLRNSIPLEIELYDYILQKFHSQYDEIVNKL